MKESPFDREMEKEKEKNSPLNGENLILGAVNDQTIGSQDESTQHEESKSGAAAAKSTAKATSP